MANCTWLGIKNYTWGEIDNYTWQSITICQRQKELSCSVLTSSSIAKSNVFKKMLLATISVASSVRRQIGKNVSANVSVGSTIQRLTAKGLTAITNSLSAVSRSVSRTLLSHSVTNSSVAKSIAKTLASVTASSASIKRTVGKIVSASNSVSASLTKLAVQEFIEVIRMTVIHSLVQAVEAIKQLRPTLTAILNKTQSVSSILVGDCQLTVINSNIQEVTWTMGADPKGNTIYMVLGETKTIELTVLTTTGTAADLTGATAKFRAEGFTADKDCTIASNVISVDLVAADFTKSGSYGYEFRIKDALNNVDSLVRGTIKVEPRLVTTF